jgi:hypothetical protein
LIERWETPVPKAKTVLFLKAHVKDYTRKDGTVVRAHEDKRPEYHNHAHAAVDVAGRVAGESGAASLAASTHALAMTQAATTPESHHAAAVAHDAAAKTHQGAADSLKYTGVGGMRGRGSGEHGTAVNLHRWAAASHRERADKEQAIHEEMDAIMRAHHAKPASKKGYRWMTDAKTGEKIEVDRFGFPRPATGKR